MKLLNVIAMSLLSVFSGDVSSFFGSAENIIQALKIMGLGMVGIFVVTIVIILLVTLLNKVTSGAKKKKDDENK